MLILWRTSEPRNFAKAWLARAHPVGTELSVHGADAADVRGRFDGIEPDGTLRLRLADGSVELVRAGDVALG
jgi:BirA family biotin operon repressor/biotin-[acetyl-CoA-carboxylase] ligase